MNTIELKQQLHEFVNSGDDNFVKTFHEMAKTYLLELNNEKMIDESEQDIQLGQIHSQEEVKKMIQGWTEV